MGVKRKPTYKQMAFETAVRNPERYLNFLLELKKFEGLILNDENLLNIVSHLYLSQLVSSDEIEINENSTVDNIKSKVEDVNSTRRADGGFPKGYCSRFWTYMRTLSELGLVYARYGEEFKLSEISKKLINGEIDEQEAYSIQAVKYNRKSPYRNVSNDFNFFTFILKILLKLKTKGSSLSYEQFILAMFSKDGNIDDFLVTIENNKFNDYESVYNFVKNNYGVNNKEQTVIHDYPDVVRRVFIISGFITIRYAGKKLIQINESKLDYINELLNIDFSLNDEEKENAKKYFDKLNSNNDFFIEIIKKYREKDKLNGQIYTNKIFDIIKNYNIDEKIIVESIEKIGTKTSVIEEFKEIPDPLKLEFFISILIALKYGKEFYIRPNYKADHIGKPYSHAPGNAGDIEIYSSKIYWLIEVTLIRNKTQQLNFETTSVIRHLHSNEEFKNHLLKYLSFIAPIIHDDTKEYYEYSTIKSQKDGYKVNLKPYSVGDFIEITLKKENFIDMESYTENVKNEFKNNFSL
ncbi:MAG: AlwI family type II restriction endonuclease [Candidatus Gracilibacteria bacterium]|nr:AlwI family type II restriction endonuclease [Candidatus Gracilibacteria bacterium]